MLIQICCVQWIHICCACNECTLRAQVVSPCICHLCQVISGTDPENFFRRTSSISQCRPCLCHVFKFCQIIFYTNSFIQITPLILKFNSASGCLVHFYVPYVCTWFNLKGALFSISKVHFPLMYKF